MGFPTVAPGAPGHRLILHPIEGDPRAAAIERGANDLGLGNIGEVAIADIVFVDGNVDSTQLDRLHSVLVDPLVVRGESNTFEATDRYTITSGDNDGELMTEGFTTATSSNGTWSTFEVAVDVSDFPSGLPTRTRRHHHVGRLPT